MSGECTIHITYSTENSCVCIYRIEHYRILIKRCGFCSYIRYKGVIENQVGRSLQFFKWAKKQMPEYFGSTADKFSAEQMYEAANVVEPGFIRVDADETTYNMHVMIRFELERAISNRLLRAM